MFFSLYFLMRTRENIPKLPLFERVNILLEPWWIGSVDVDLYYNNKGELVETPRKSYGNIY